jgi:two-component SAPR family response regulator
MNIIAVDDERFALLDLKSAVEEAFPDNTLTCFDSSKNALEYSKNNPIDLAFLDIDMGGMNGLQLANHLKNINEKIKLVFVTGHVMHAINTFAVSVSGYIVKPVTVKAIQAAVGSN